MVRTPDCQYLGQTKHPDYNEGNAEYHCSMFDWTDTRFTTLMGSGVLSNIGTTFLNEGLFKQCFNCPYNRNGGG